MIIFHKRRYKIQVLLNVWPTGPPLWLLWAELFKPCHLSLCLSSKTRVAPVIVSKAGVSPRCVYQGFPHNVCISSPSTRLVFISKFSFSCFHLHRLPSNIRRHSVLLWLTGSPQEGCVLSLRPANGSCARAALWDCEGLSTTGSVQPNLLHKIAM